MGKRLGWCCSSSSTIYVMSRRVTRLSPKIPLGCKTLPLKGQPWRPSRKMNPPCFHYSHFFCVTEILRLRRHNESSVPTSTPSLAASNGESYDLVGPHGAATSASLSVADLGVLAASSSGTSCDLRGQWVHVGTPTVCRMPLENRGQILFKRSWCKMALGVFEMCRVWGRVRNPIFVFWKRRTHLLQRWLPKVLKQLSYVFYDFC